MDSRGKHKLAKRFEANFTSKKRRLKLVSFQDVWPRNIDQLPAKGSTSSNSSHTRKCTGLSYNLNSESERHSGKFFLNKEGNSLAEKSAGKVWRYVIVRGHTWASLLELMMRHR